MAINLDNLLSEYDQKRRKAEMDAEARKQELYKKYPNLDELEKKINYFAISKTRAILNSLDNSINYDKEILKLKKEREDFFIQNQIEAKRSLRTFFSYSAITHRPFESFPCDNTENCLRAGCSMQ